MLSKKNVEALEKLLRRHHGGVVAGALKTLQEANNGHFPETGERLIAVLEMAKEALPFATKSRIKINRLLFELVQKALFSIRDKKDADAVRSLSLFNKILCVIPAEVADKISSIIETTKKKLLKSEKEFVLDWAFTTLPADTISVNINGYTAERQPINEFFGKKCFRLKLSSRGNKPCYSVWAVYPDGSIAFVCGEGNTFTKGRAAEETPQLLKDMMFNLN